MKTRHEVRRSSLAVQVGGALRRGSTSHPRTRLPGGGGAIGWKPETLDTYYTSQTVKELRSVLDGEGMLLSQFVANPGELASGDGAVRAQAVENFKRYSDVGAGLGTTIVNTVTHYPFAVKYPPLMNRLITQTFTVEMPADFDWKQNWLDYVDAIRQCAQYAESVGLKYSLEMHPFRYAATTEGLLRLIGAVDCPALGANFDPSHTFPMGDMTHVAIYRLADRLWHCDFSDNDGTTNMHFRPGKGKIDWAAAMKAFKESVTTAWFRWNSRIFPAFRGACGPRPVPTRQTPRRHRPSTAST